MVTTKKWCARRLRLDPVHTNWCRRDLRHRMDTFSDLLRVYGKDTSYDPSCKSLRHRLSPEIESGSELLYILRTCIFRPKLRPLGFICRYRLYMEENLSFVNVHNRHYLGRVGVKGGDISTPHTDRAPGGPFTISS